MSIPARARVGLVGRNGCGKSTLLRLISGELQSDGGDIVMPRGWRLGMLPQEPPDGPEALIDIVVAADTERTALLAEVETTDDAARLADAHDRLNMIDAHSAEARAGTILAGLGFPHAAQSRAVGELSGGWRMRVALAANLFARPDLLLLDEPTNHLDLEATIWLESYLKTWTGTVILVSHERDVLDRVTDRTLHLHDGTLELYTGGFGTFEQTRRARLAVQAAQQRRQEQERARIQAFVDRFRAKATKARQAQSRIKMLERMQPVAAIVEESVPNMTFPQPEALSPPILTLDGVSVGYGREAADAPVLRNLNLRIDMDDRIALIGQNGNGKSTLARLVVGRLQPAGGRIVRSPKLRIGYFAQHQQEELDLGATGLQHMQRAMPDAQPSACRAQLGRFGFPQERSETRVGAMSGGEKSRLLLALTSRTAPHMLVLDEPTNHLDMETRDALVEALNEFQGAVILVTHDPQLVSLVADRLWLVADGTVTPFDGDIDDYRRLVEGRGRGAPTQMAADAGVGERSDRRGARRAGAALRQSLAPYRKAAQAAERQLERLAAEKAGIEARLADPSIYDGPAEAHLSLQRQIGVLEARISEAEAAWLEAHEALETAESELTG